MLPRLHVYGSHLSEGLRAELAAAGRRHVAEALGAERRSVEGGEVVVHGFAASTSVLARHSLLLAPLRFGAGVKGKVLDAWGFGTPVVTTPVGAEGIAAVTPCPGDGSGDADGSDDGGGWGGLWDGLADQQRDLLGLHDAAVPRAIAAAEATLRPFGGSWLGGGPDDTGAALWGGAWWPSDTESLARAAARLLRDERAWTACSRAAVACHARATDPARFDDGIAPAAALARDPAALLRQRASNTMQAVLWQTQHRATQFMAKFIEAKERARDAAR